MRADNRIKDTQAKISFFKADNLLLMNGCLDVCRIDVVQLVKTQQGYCSRIGKSVH